MGATWGGVWIGLVALLPLAVYAAVWKWPNAQVWSPRVVPADLFRLVTGVLFAGAGGHALGPCGDGGVAGPPRAVLGVPDGTLAHVERRDRAGGDGRRAMAPVATAPVVGASHAGRHDPRHAGPPHGLWDLSGDADAVGAGD